MGKFAQKSLFFSSGDGSVSFEEFVEILSNMAANSPGFNKDEEEKELRDAFR